MRSAPDDGLDSADEGVGGHEDAGDEDDAGDAPAGDLLQADRDTEHDRGAAGDLGEQVANDSVNPRPGPEALFKMLVGGDGSRVAVELHEITRGNEDREGDGKREDEGIPVLRVGLAGDADEGVAGKVGAEEAEADDPAGEAAARFHESGRVPAAPGEPEADGEDDDDVGREDDGIERLHVGGGAKIRRGGFSTLTLNP
ncbi:MAG: hypothetical protein NWT04_08480 [Verrucomicrobiales bacterium]|nr:hypothetical protein [Verrucomicrobiales bacterium]